VWHREQVEVSVELKLQCSCAAGFIIYHWLTAGVQPGGCQQLSRAKIAALQRESVAHGTNPVVG
jgi:hypothetical protein